MLWCLWGVICTVYSISKRSANILKALSWMHHIDRMSKIFGWWAGDLSYFLLSSLEDQLEVTAVNNCWIYFENSLHDLDESRDE